MLPRREEKYRRTSCMQKLERLGWTKGRAFSSYGASIGVRVNDADLMARVEALLPPGVEPATSPVVDDLWSFYAAPASTTSGQRNYHLLYDNSSRAVRTLDLDEVFETFASVIHLNVAVRAAPCLFVHAGVVEWDGRALVLPGRSMTGKSVLVAALVRAGATYYSDEYAVFDEAGRVQPYPRPLSLREEGGGRQRVTAEALGGATGARPLPVGLIAAAPYECGARWQPRPLTSGEAVLKLLANTVMARSRSEEALRVLRQAVSGATALEGVRGEADEAAARLLEVLEPGPANAPLFPMPAA